MTALLNILVMIMLKCVFLTFFVLLVSGQAFADDRPELSERGSQLISQFDIGEAVECAEGRLKSSRAFKALDDNHIQIRMAGKKGYLAILGQPGRCQGLYKYGRFSISAEKRENAYRKTSYCVGDRVSASTSLSMSGGDSFAGLDVRSGNGGFCTIIEMRELVKKTAKE